MKNSNQHKEDISRLHKDRLGMEVPEDFFAKSKANILNSVIKPEKTIQSVFWLKPMIAYPMAASIILAIAITFWMQNNNTIRNEQITNTENIEILNSDILHSDFLISSLMVSEHEMDEYLDSYILNKVVFEAELSEQQLENIFINSVLLEDSLISDYIDKSLIENIVL